MQIRSHANAEIVFNYFCGECFNNDNQLVVMIQIDDGGCICEDVDGEEKFYEFHELNVDDNIYQSLLEIKEDLKDK